MQYLPERILKKNMEKKDNFLNLEKTYDRVIKKEIWSSLRKNIYLKSKFYMKGRKLKLNVM